MQGRNTHPACGQLEPQLLRCGQFATLVPLTKAGALLNIVSSSNEPQSGHGMRFSDFSAIEARILCSPLHFTQRKSYTAASARSGAVSFRANPFLRNKSRLKSFRPSSRTGLKPPVLASRSIVSDCDYYLMANNVLWHGSDCFVSRLQRKYK